LLLLLLLLLSYYSPALLAKSHKLVIISDKFTVCSWILFFISPAFSFLRLLDFSSYDTAAAAAATMISPRNPCATFAQQTNATTRKTLTVMRAAERWEFAH
jgi:hypothetical protein